MKVAQNHVETAARHPRARTLRRPVAAQARKFLKALGLKGCELSVSLVGDRTIRRLNRDWRKKDQATDVLSFPLGEVPSGGEGPRQLGDVVISVETAARQAKQRGRALRDEVALYLAHGLLHLLGHDHQRAAQARRMAKEERRLLGRRGMVR